MNKDNDLTMHSWFAGEDDHVWLAHNDHLEFSRSRSVERSHKKVYKEMFDNTEYIKIPPDFTFVSDLKLLHKPESCENWDWYCIGIYTRLFKDNKEHVRGYGKYYEAEMPNFDCHRCGDELNPLNTAVFGELCVECDEDISDEKDFQL